MILGIDEVGRGSLAGPLVVGAVALIIPVEGLADSKLLSQTKRLELSKKIHLGAKVAKLGWVSNVEIDSLGLTKAMELAIERALKDIDLKQFEIVIDGNINYLAHLLNSSCLIKADQTVSEVSAASIIAKVARDEYMYKISVKYPSYGFSKNVGYGTSSHLTAINKHGLSDIHRTSFKLKKRTS